MRTLDPQIMTDPWFIELNDRARLAWIMLVLSGADDQGRFLMNGRVLKSQLFPADDTPAQEVAAIIESFAQDGKVISYEVNGVRYGQIVNWWKHQGSSAWMSASKYPAPAGWHDRYRYHGKGNKIIQSANWSLGSQLPSPLPSNDVNGDVNGNGEGEVNGNGEGEQSTAAAAETIRPVLSLYEKEIGPMTPIIMRAIIDESRRSPPERIMAALEESARSNKRSWNYAEAILNRWHVEGYQPREAKKSPQTPKEDKTQAVIAQVVAMRTT